MRKIALYARVSTQDQHPEAQLAPLRAYAERRGEAAAEYVDRISGATDSRPGLDAMMEAARRRELAAVVVVKLDRIARSVRHLTALGAELDALGVALVVLDQALDTSTPSGRLLFHVLGSIAEFERDLIRERVKAGMTAAKRRGAKIGRPSSLDGAGRCRARALREEGRSLVEVAEALGCSKSAAYRATSAS